MSTIIEEKYNFLENTNFMIKTFIQVYRQIDIFLLFTMKSSRVNIFTDFLYNSEKKMFCKYLL